MSSNNVKAWRPVEAGPLTGVNWTQMLDRDCPVDPYLVWADVTQLSGFAGETQAPEKLKWPILLQFQKGLSRTVPVTPGSTDCSSSVECHPVLGLLAIPGAYKATDREKHLDERRSDYVTALISPNSIAELLRCTELVKRFQLGLPRIPGVATAPHDQRIHVPILNVREVPRVVVGVIDDGFAVTHSSFRQSARNGLCEPRVAFLWDQYSPQEHARTAPWLVLSPEQRTPEGVNVPGTSEFGYGAELKQNGIEQAIAESEQIGTGAQYLHGLDAYRFLDYAPRHPYPNEMTLRLERATPHATSAPLQSIGSSTHGTSVAALAAGSRLTLPRYHAAQGQWPVSEKDKDYSEHWPLVLVQLPSRTSLDSSGGSLGVHILDGLHYIISRARKLPYLLEKLGPTQAVVSAQDASVDAQPSMQNMKSVQPGETVKPNYFPKNKIVVNISYGAVAGPHDGTSMLEEAIADLVCQEPNLWVVVAAGNAHGSKTHSRLELTESGDAKSLTWTVGPDNLLESYLEIWFPDCDIQGQRLNASWLDTVTITLQPPGGLPKLAELKRGEARLLAESDRGLPLAAAIFARQVAQGRRGTMLLLTCARTHRPLHDGWDLPPLPKPVAPHGRWEITLRWGVGRQPTGRKMVVHAWAERNDQLWGHGRRQQSSVAGEDPVPDRTDFSPSVREFAQRGRLGAHSDDVPRPFQAELSGGSLSRIPNSTHQVGPDWPEQSKGQSLDNSAAIVVGGRRLSDGEMARYSGAGVSRASPLDRGRIPGGDGASVAVSVRTAVDMDYRKTVRIHGPDIDAPSDIGTALRGLRTIGFREGSVARLGGTSAAAPLVTRYVASALYQRHGLEGPLDPARKTELAPLEEQDRPLQRVESRRRPTGTPTRDDRVHRGQVSLGPKPTRK